MKAHSLLLSAAIAFLLPIIASGQKPYFQQRVDTRIDVTLDDVHHTLHGQEEFTYTNNSPDTLKYLYIHLWPNAYSHDHTEFAEQQYRGGNKKFYFAKPSQRGYIDSLQFEVDGREVLHFSAEPTPDITRIDLPSPLAPGGIIKVSTPFKVKVPIVFSRLGHTGQAYFISQWFPKPAVYDKYGWHPIPYLDNGEFFSEIGSYDVSITLPKNYIVMATGNLQDAEEQIWLDSLANTYQNRDSTTAGRKKDSTRVGNTAIAGANSRKDTAVKSSPIFKTIHYKEDNVHDFAWFADKRWEVKKDTIVQTDGSVVTTWVAYLPSYRKSWSKGNEHLKNAVKYYGQWVGLYPYKTIKAVQGDMNAGGGMEYPTVTVIDRTVGGSADVIIHEAGHNWFYGMLASNERDHAWMDEGINTFYEQRTTEATSQTKKDSTAKVGTGGVSIDINMKNIIYQLQASGKDEAIEQTSNNMPEINYGLGVYYKTASLLQWLEEYMDKEAFEAAMHDYFNTWKHRHPYPEDFRAVMEKHTDKPLDWFFKQLQSDRQVDFAVKGVDRKNGNVTVTIKNKTGEKLPVAIGLYRSDSLLAQSVSASFTGKTTLTLPDTAGWDKIQILPSVFDARTSNNTYRRNGLFHRSGLAIRPLVGTTMTDKQKMFVLPALGYNVYDGFMAGLLLHNLTWPQHKFQFALAPMYAFRSKEFVGAGSVSYSWFPRSNFEEIRLQGDVKSFHFDELDHYYDGLLFKRYTKVAPSLEFTFKERLGTSPIKRRLLLKGYAIQEDDFAFDKDPADTAASPRFLPRIIDHINYYGLIRYTHQNDRPFNPFSYVAEGQMGEYFAKLSLEGNLRIDYNRPKKSLYIRAYAGKFFEMSNAGNNVNRYYLNSTFTGVNDYLYDDTYIGRSEVDGLPAHQLSIREGGIKIATPSLAASRLGTLGRSDNWLASVNLKTDLPIKLPIRLWLDAATFANANELNPSGDKVLYAGGAEVHIRDVISIYIPFIMSRDYNDYTKSFYPDNRFLNTISFSIQLQNINWLKAPSKIFSLAGY